MIVPGLLPPDIALHVAHELSGLLPPPADDAPDSEHFRDQTAFLKVADLQPATILEASFAVDCVIAGAQARFCFRQLHAPDTTPAEATRTRAQALSLLRQSYAALRMLHRYQAERRRNDIPAEPALPPPHPIPAAAQPAPPAPAPALNRKARRLLQRTMRAHPAPSSPQALIAQDLAALEKLLA